MASNQCPSLPNELWTQILENLRADEDLPILWMSCRNVSTAFREAVETIFREQHLPKTRLYFFLGEFLGSSDEDEPEDRRLTELLAEFNFSSLSEGRVTATFAVDDDELPESLHPITRKRLRKYVNDINIELPRHTVQIRRDVNDGPIPGLKVDYEKLELSCNWRELFGAFYSEEYLYHKHTAESLKEMGSWLAELKSKVDRGELDPIAVMKKALAAFADDSKDCRKLARRARICWQLKKHDGTEWEFGRDGDEDEERKCLAELQNIRHFASLEEFSDEGEGDDEDEEDESEEEQEEEEWQDTDSEEDN